MVDYAGTTYLVRLRIPDRPGALGAVAARIGAVRGDVRGIEILERSETVAIDEFAVALASTDLLPLLESELECIDGVVVEDISLLEVVEYDPQLAGFEIAAILVGADNKTDLFDAICDHVQRAVRSSFTLVISENDVVMASAGDVPRDLQGVASISMPIGSSGLSLIIGRTAPSFRARERQRVAALARIGAAWLLQLEERARARSLSFHPSAMGGH